MEIKKVKLSKKSGRSGISTGMYIVSAVVAVIGVALLFDNLLLFKRTVDQYVGQGYATSVVIKELLPSLLPQIFEPIAIYGGIAFVLLGVGIVNNKVSKCLTMLTKVDVSSDVIEENIVEENIEKQDVLDIDNAEIIEHTETVEEIIEVK